MIEGNIGYACLYKCHLEKINIKIYFEQNQHAMITIINMEYQKITFKMTFDEIYLPSVVSHKSISLLALKVLNVYLLLN